MLCAMQNTSGVQVRSKLLLRLSMLLFSMSLLILTALALLPHDVSLCLLQGSNCVTNSQIRNDETRGASPNRSIS